MDAYQKMMSASRKPSQKKAKEKAERVACPNCDSTFSNEGALTRSALQVQAQGNDGQKRAKKRFIFPRPARPHGLLKSISGCKEAFASTQVLSCVKWINSRKEKLEFD